MQPKRVSILMPVYNGGVYLDQAVTSILTQTFTDFELIIVNDGSTDSTTSQLATLRDPRVHIINLTKNQGIVNALNAGLKACQGELIARQDVDDLSHPSRLEKQVQFLSTHPRVGLLGTWYTKMDENAVNLVERHLAITDKDIQALLLHYNPFCHGSIMLRRSLLQQVGPYRDTGGPTEDYDLWLRLLEVTEGANLPESLYRWRVNLNSILAAQSDSQAAMSRDLILSCAAFRKNRGFDPLQREDPDFMARLTSCRNALNQRRIPSRTVIQARNCYLLAEDMLKLNQRKNARLWALRALRQWPLMLPAWRLLLGTYRLHPSGAPE